MKCAGKYINRPLSSSMSVAPAKNPMGQSTASTGPSLMWAMPGRSVGLPVALSLLTLSPSPSMSQTESAIRRLNPPCR